MKIPKIKIKKMTLDENISIIKWAYFENNDTLNAHKYVVEYFEEIASINQNLSPEEVNQIIEKVVTNNYIKYESKIKNEIERYNSLWEEYNDKYFESLSTYLNIKWPDNIDEIIATVGLIPVFPRDLDKHSFSMSTDLEDWKLIEVCAHETLHFLWFEKWKQLYPETSKKEYNSPYLVWQYSEMVTDPILNNKPFSNIFDFIEHSYDSFYTILDNGEKVMDKLRNIYSKNISIEEKIKFGFEYINKVLNK